MISDLIGTQEVSKELGISRKAVLRLVSNKRLPYDYFSSGVCGYRFSKKIILELKEKRNDFFTLLETSLFLQIHKNEIYALCTKGILQKENILGVWMYSKKSIYAYHAYLLEQQKHIYFFLHNFEDIKTKIKTIHVSRVNISKHLQVSKSSVDKWLSGAVIPSEENAKKLLNLFGFVL